MLEIREKSISKFVIMNLFQDPLLEHSSEWDFSERERVDPELNSG